MRKPIILSFVILLANLVQAAIYPSDTCSYHIISALGGRFLTVKDGSDVAGATLEIRSHTGAESDPNTIAQIWSLAEFGRDHWYFIRNRQGKVIDLKDGIVSNGATVQMWNFGGYSNHMWQLVDAGAGYFYIK